MERRSSLDDAVCVREMGEDFFESFTECPSLSSSLFLSSWC